MIFIAVFNLNPFISLEKFSFNHFRYFGSNGNQLKKHTGTKLTLLVAIPVKQYSWQVWIEFI